MTSAPVSVLLSLLLSFLSPVPGIMGTSPQVPFPSPFPAGRDIGKGLGGSKLIWSLTPGNAWSFPILRQEDGLTETHFLLEASVAVTERQGAAWAPHRPPAACIRWEACLSAGLQATQVFN